MKYLISTLLVFFVYVSAHAQTCNTSLLFKKGAKLEYKNYLPLYFKSDDSPVEITRVTLEVTDVVTANNITTSTVIKKESSPTNKNYQFELKKSLTCDEKDISFPYDLYSPDTIYKCDANRNVKDTGYGYGYSSVEAPYMRKIPFDLNKKTVLNSYKVNVKMSNSATKAQSQEIVVRGGRTGEYSYWTTTPAKPAGSIEQVAEIKNIKVDGMETVSTPAGDFECYKITYDYETVSNGIKVKLKMSDYYDPAIGIIKSEFAYNKIRATTTELVKIKK